MHGFVDGTERIVRIKHKRMLQSQIQVTCLKRVTKMSLDSPVCGVIGYRLEEEGSVPDNGKKFSTRHFAHTSSRVDIISYSMGTGCKAAAVCN
jgi:hypothetical protein